MQMKHWRRGLLIGVLLLVNVWLLSHIINLAEKARIAMSHAREVRAEYDALEKRTGDLRKDLADLATPRGKDAALRTAFGVARPGEELVVVVPPDAPAAPPQQSWWQKLWNWL